MRLFDYMPPKVKDFHLVASGIGLNENADQAYCNLQASQVMSTMTEREKELNAIAMGLPGTDVEKNFPGFKFNP